MHYPGILKRCAQQLSVATQKHNIHYSVQTAESSNFTNEQFDLVTVAQAVHWFDLEKFYAEAKRILNPEGLLALIGYGLIKTEDVLNDVILHFYKNVVGPYWDAERSLVDEHYETLHFPFKEIKSPMFSMEYQWTLQELVGYFETWSAAKHYKAALEENATAKVFKHFDQNWGSSNKRKFTFPVFLRAGYK